MCDLIRRSDKDRFQAQIFELGTYFFVLHQESTKKNKYPVAGERKSVFDSIATTLTVKRFFTTAHIL